MNLPRPHIDRDTAVMYAWLLVAFAIMISVVLVSIGLTFGVGWLSVFVIWLAVAAFGLSVVMIGGRRL